MYMKNFNRLISLVLLFTFICTNSAYPLSTRSRDTLRPALKTDNLLPETIAALNEAERLTATAEALASGHTVGLAQVSSKEVNKIKGDLKKAIDKQTADEDSLIKTLLFSLISNINKDFRYIYTVMAAIKQLTPKEQQALEEYILSQPDLRHTPLAHRVVDREHLTGEYLVQRPDVPEEISTLDTVGGKIHNLFRMVRYFLKDTVAKRLLKMGIDKPSVPTVYGIAGAGHNFFLRLNRTNNEVMLDKIREQIINLDAQDAHESSIAEGAIAGYHDKAIIPVSLVDELFAEFLLLSVQEGLITKDKIEGLMTLKNSQAEIKIGEFLAEAKEKGIIADQEVADLINLAMSVRSSSYYEDRPVGAAAGLQDTFLNVTFKELFTNVVAGFASLWKAMPIVYRDLLVFDEWLTQKIDKEDLQKVTDILESRYNKAYISWRDKNLDELVTRVEKKNKSKFKKWEDFHLQRLGPKISEDDLKVRYIEGKDPRLVIEAFEAASENFKVARIAIKDGKTISTREVVSRFKKAIKGKGERKEQFVSTYRLGKVLDSVRDHAPDEVGRLEKALKEIRGKIVDPLNVGMGIAVQAMRQSEFCITGFTVNKASKMTGFSNNTLLVTFDATYGLGPYLVEGKVKPDRFEIYIDLETNKAVIALKSCGTKEVMMTREHPDGVAVPEEMRRRFSITESLDESDINQKAIEIARWVVEVQGALGKTVDTEALYYKHKGRLIFNTVQMRAVAMTLDKEDPENLRLTRTIPEPEWVQDANKFGGGVATGNAGAGKAIYIDEKTKPDVSAVLTHASTGKTPNNIDALKKFLPERNSEPFKEFKKVKESIDEEWFTQEEFLGIIWRSKRAKNIAGLNLEKKFKDFKDMSPDELNTIIAFIGRRNLVGTTETNIVAAIDGLKLSQSVSDPDGFRAGLKAILTELTMPISGGLTDEVRDKIIRDRQSLLITIYTDVRSNTSISDHLFAHEVNVFQSEILLRQIDRFIDVVDELKNVGETVGMLAADPKPEYDRAMMVAAYVITLTGSETSHASIFCGERGIPAVVGIVINPGLLAKEPDILNKVKRSEVKLTVDANQGTIYLGKGPIVEEIIFYPVRRWQHFKTKVGLILASLLDAERVAKLSLWAPKWVKELGKKISGHYGFSLDRIEEALLAIGVDFRAAEAYDNLQLLNNKTSILTRLGELEAKEKSLIAQQASLDNAVAEILKETELGPEVPEDERAQWLIAHVDDLLASDKTLEQFGKGKENVLKRIQRHKNSKVTEQVRELARLKANKKQLELLKNPKNKKEKASSKRMMDDIEKLTQRKDIQEKIIEKITGYQTAQAYIRDKLKAHFIGLSKTVTPDQLVLVRARDFKKNEIINDLIGAELFYNDERASMVGDRGTGLEVRDENIYALDIQILAMNDAMRETRGTNTGTFGFFFVFLRTPAELKKGLERIAYLYDTGQIDQLPPCIGMMLELGNNVPMVAEYTRILADFAKKYGVHTFFSYGTNDLTQSVKKADRDEKRFKMTKLHIPGTNKVVEVPVFDEGDPAVIDAIKHSALEARRIIAEEYSDEFGAPEVEFTLGVCGNAGPSLLKKKTIVARRAAMQIAAIVDSMGTTVPQYGDTVSLVADSHLETNYINDEDAGRLTKVVEGNNLRDHQKGAALRRVVFIKNNGDLFYEEELPDGTRLPAPKIVEGDIVVLGADVDFLELNAKAESILEIELSKASGVITSAVPNMSPVMSWLNEHWKKPTIISRKPVFKALEDNADYLIDFQRGTIYAEKDVRLHTEKIKDDTIFTDVDYEAEPEKVNVRRVSMDDIYEELGLHPFAFAVYLYKKEELKGTALKAFEEAYNDLRAFQREKEGIAIDAEVERETVEAVEALMEKYDVRTVGLLINKVVRQYIDAAVAKAEEQGELVVFETSQEEPDFFRGREVGGEVLFKGLKFGKAYERETQNSPIGFRGLLKNISDGNGEATMMFLRAVKDLINKHGQDKVAIQLNMAHNAQVLDLGVEFLRQAGFELGKGKDKVGFGISTISSYIRIYDYLEELAKKGVVTFCTIDNEQLGQDHLLVDFKNKVELYDGSKVPLFPLEGTKATLVKPIAIIKTAMEKMDLKETVEIGLASGHTVKSKLSSVGFEYAVLRAAEGIANPAVFIEIAEALLEKGVPTRITTVNLDELEDLKAKIGLEKFSELENRGIRVALLEKEERKQLRGVKGHYKDNVIDINGVEVFNITDKIDAGKKLRGIIDGAV